MQDDEKRPNVYLHIDGEKVARVVAALGNGDVSECLAPDVKHVCDVLAHVRFCEAIAPGFLGEMFAIFIPQFIKNHNRAALAEVAQKKADEGGFGDDWRSVLEAGKHPLRKDFIPNLVALHEKLNGGNQNAAIKAIAEQSGRDADSIRRVVTRSKKRKK